MKFNELEKKKSIRNIVPRKRRRRKRAARSKRLATSSEVATEYLGRFAFVGVSL
jgi:hypothetical protein